MSSVVNVEKLTLNCHFFDRYREMNDRLAMGYGLSAVLLWSTVATAFKMTLSYFSPAQMLAGASLVSCLAIFGVAIAQGKCAQILPMFKARPLYFLLLSVINPFIYYLILFKAYDLLPASVAQPINYTWAITLTFMSAIFLKQQIRRQDWIAAALGYIGVVIIATQGNFSDLSGVDPQGVALALCSTLLWAGFWILNAKNKADPVVSLFLSFLLALPMTWAVALLESWSSVPWQGWASLVYVGLFEMGITFVFWLKAIQLSSNTAKISNLIFISPFISLILLSQIIDENIPPTSFIGLIMIVAGLIIQQRNREN